MIYGFTLASGPLRPVPVDQLDASLASLVWLDVVNPTPGERHWIFQACGYTPAAPEDLGDIIASARFYRDAQGLYLNAYATLDDRPADGPLDGTQSITGGASGRNVTVAFALIGERLITVHRDDHPQFRMFRSRLGQPVAAIADARDILLELMEDWMEDEAARLQGAYLQLEALSRGIFDQARPDMERVLAHLAHLEDRNSKGRLALQDNHRSLKLLTRNNYLAGAQAERLDDLIIDIESLLTHVGFCFDKIDFLMDSAMGMINIEQNKVIKLFSIAAVLFLPPTLVATIYGMNFDRMPELHWPFGYLFALLLMLGSAVATVWYFRRRRWM